MLAPVTIMRDQMKSFRPLLYFWGAVLGLIALGAVTLALLGAPGSAPARLEVSPALPAAPPPPRPPAPKPAPVVVGIADPDPSLLEPNPGLPDRMLPRIAESGRTPAQAYAASFDKNERHPRIALVIDGIGLDRALGEQALHNLPSAIDIAFSVYAVPQAIDGLGQEARRQGRECLVSIPMEPSGFPVVEEGDKSLLTGGIPQQNRLNLDWALSSVQGCVGATGASDGMAGERFAESRQAFGDVLAAMDRRGLLYLDPRPGAPPPDDASQGDNPPRVVDVVVDRPVSPDEPASADMIDKNLAALEKIASEHGTAIGLAGPPRVVLLERLAVWANGLAGRGMVLAPLTAIPPRAAMPDGTP